MSIGLIKEHFFAPLYSNKDCQVIDFFSKDSKSLKRNALLNPWGDKSLYPECLESPVCFDLTGHLQVLGRKTGE